VNEIFKESDDYYGETILDVKLVVYLDINQVCLWCKLDEGTTESDINKDGYINFCRSGWYQVSDKMNEWVYNAVQQRKISKEMYEIPFES